jgi:GGDEF domain-containing protein
VSTSRSPARPVAVADIRLGDVLDSAEDLAKRWLLALLDNRPLQRAGELSLVRFAQHAPALCAQVLRALQSDGELDGLRLPAPAGDDGDPAEQSVRVDLAEQSARVDQLLGATDAAEVVDAFESLRAVLWRALAGTLENADADVVGRVSDRLAHACSLLSARALASQVVVPTAAEPDPAAPGENDRAPRIEVQLDAGDARVPEPDLEDPWAIDAPAPQEDSPWSAHVASEIERRFVDGEPFAVLLIEVVSFERLRDAEDPGELDELMAVVQQALEEPLGRSARLAAEGAGRWWLVAWGLHAVEGRTLADRLAHRVSVSVSHRGVPLKVAIGIAVSPEDGREAAELAERAEDELYAARAAGVEVLPARATSAAPGPGVEP